MRRITYRQKNTIYIAPCKVAGPTERERGLLTTNK
jgi:hypothetical protein